MEVSSLPRSMRVSTGEAPPLEKATINGERSRMAGMMKLHSSGSSTTFTGMLCACATSETRRLTLRSSVAAMASVTPSRCCASKPAPTHSTPCCPAKSGVIQGATTRTRAPASSNTPALRLATSPPPTTRHSLPLTFRNIGRNSMLLHRLQDQQLQRFKPQPCDKTLVAFASGDAFIPAAGIEAASFFTIMRLSMCWLQDNDRHSYYTIKAIQRPKQTGRCRYPPQIP